MTSSYNVAPTSSESSLYKLLGVPENISQVELARCYKKLSLELHPDRVAYRVSSDAENEAKIQEKYQRITEAYGILSDPERRAAYDRKHSINFSKRVNALRETLERSEDLVKSAMKRHCPETSGNNNHNIGKEEEEEEDDEEYSPE